MERIRHRADFLAAAAAARAGTAAFAVQHRRRNDAGPSRVGFTVTRKVGSAVERNRIRRRLRALIGHLGPDAVRPHSDYVMIGRRAALHRDFAVMLDDLRTALTRLDTPGRDRPRPLPNSSEPPRGDVS